ncbi:MAG TPA: helix-turn-helix transcriptional regulator [Burkholderiales bacterium]|nr:helix-turn-helix transcriptional regulator [Burkholderiales bacterium]
MVLSEKINYLMAQMGLSANELSINSNIERSTLTRILNGSTANPRLETIHTLAKYFGVEAHKLLDNSFENDFKIADNKTIKFKTTKEILANLMLKTGILSISLLHKYTGIPFSVLSEILSGKTEKPSIKTLQTLASFFNLTLAQIMGMDPISPFQIAEINHAKKILPILQFNQIEQWFSGDLKSVKSYINSSRQIIGQKSFSIHIDSIEFQPDFSKSHVIIIDNEEDFSNNDFLIAKLNDNISIFEFKQKEGIVFLREAGKEEYKKICSYDKFTNFGVVIQQIINRK